MSKRGGWNKGLTKETDIRVATNAKHISESLKGRRLSKEHREKLSKAKQGYIPWNKGKKGLYIHSEETRRKCSGKN